MVTIAALQRSIRRLAADKKALLKHVEKSCGMIPLPPKRLPRQLLDISQVLAEALNLEPEKVLLPSTVPQRYQKWYSSSRAILSKNQPYRLDEFDEVYKSVRTIIDSTYITGEQQSEFVSLIERQFRILDAVSSHLKFSAYDIELTVYSVLMKDELEAARHLLSKGFLRAAGAVAGVVLERHLKLLLRKHIPPVKHSEKETLSNLNSLCKGNVYDNVTWGKIDYLARLRNLCDHDKDREPTKKEVRAFCRSGGHFGDSET